MRPCLVVGVVCTVTAAAHADDNAKLKQSIQDSGVAVRAYKWQCHSDKHDATMIFDTEGKVLCVPDSIAEEARIHIVVAMTNDFVNGLRPATNTSESPEAPAASPATVKPEDLYTITVTAGDKIGTRVHGDISSIKESAKDITSKSAAGTCDYAPEDARQYVACVVKDHDAVSAKDLTIEISIKSADVSNSTKVNISQYYYLGVALFGSVGFKDRTTYKVANGKIASDVDAHPIDYYLIAEAPLPFFGTRRYYDEYDDWTMRFSAMAGVDLSAPKDGFALGLSFELAVGVGIGVAWTPRRVAIPKDGKMVGDAVMGDNVDTEKQWSLREVNVGLTLDQSALESLAKIFK